MFVSRTFTLIVGVVGALLSGSAGRSGNARGQRGFSTLTLALIGLLAGSSLATPAMQLAAGTLASSVGPSASIDARSAAEHALWRLRYDPTVHDEMNGSPPETTYVLGFPSGDATITIEASSDPPDNNGLNASLTVTPNLILEETAATVTYTLVLTNDDVESHDVTRFEADPHAFTPAYLTGTTTGATTTDPVYQAGKWRWDLITPVTVNGFGGTTSISWQMSINEDEGQYWVRGRVRVDSIGNVDAPLSEAVRANESTDVVVTTTVTPNEVVAGSPQTYTFTINIDNIGPSNDATPEFVKHWTSTLFDHSSGTTTGMSTADPSRNHDVINSRWEWTWDISGVVIGPLSSASISFDMTATLLPNTYFASSGVRTAEDDNSNGQELTAGTGDSAPITVVRSYTITAIHDGKTVTVIANVTSSGVEIVSWVESS